MSHPQQGDLPGRHPAYPSCSSPLPQQTSPGRSTLKSAFSFKKRLVNGWYVMLHHCSSSMFSSVSQIGYPELNLSFASSKMVVPHIKLCWGPQPAPPLSWGALRIPTIWWKQFALPRASIFATLLAQAPGPRNPRELGKLSVSGMLKELRDWSTARNSHLLGYVTATRLGSPTNQLINHDCWSAGSLSSTPLNHH